MKPSIVMFVAGGLICTAALTLASHVEVPPVSDGGEFAYIRNYDDDVMERAEAGDEITATYVAWRFEHDTMDLRTDRIVDWTSRGRSADSVVFQEIQMPLLMIGLEGPQFREVQQYERGMVTTDQLHGCLGLLNGVNAGFTFIAKLDAALEFVPDDDYVVGNVTDQRVELMRDGHTLAIQTTGGSLQVDGLGEDDLNLTVTVDLSGGGQVRSWLDGGAFPSTTQVMHAEFDHLADECGLFSQIT